MYRRLAIQATAGVALLQLASLIVAARDVWGGRAPLP
jgi:hypothetical protein